jgi:tetratricopeptide (TPR) repeat protein
MKNGDAKLLAEYGRAYLAALDVPKGREILRLAEAKEPKDGAVLRLIALAWLKNGFKSEALSAYEQVLRRDPKNKEALAQSGVDLAEVGLVNESEKYMNAFLEREPEDWQWFLAFGRAYLTGGFRKQAAPWFARAVALKPDKDDVMVGILRAFTDTQSVM